ncbi:MAG: restriction endonuclease subunit S [Oscillospiraceae bacterium]|nr:restriction endonuclease subunit S [Oscillospiraceae bacterium]
MTAQQLKNSILQMAVQGKLVPQDPNDEPASVLLERIRAEKERLIKEKKIKKEKNPSVIFRGANNLPYEKVGKNEPVCIADDVPFEIPKSWEWVRLGSIGDWGSGATPSRTHPEYYGGNIPWLKTGDLNDGYIKSVPEFITDLALEKTSVRLNPVGSVLIAMYGATIGKLGILSIPATTNQACCACLPYSDFFNEYLFYFLMSQKQAFIKRGEGGAQPNISKEKIISTLLPVPPVEEQHRIVKKLKILLPVIEKYANAEIAVDRLNKDFPEALKRSILQWAVQGKLVPQDPSDEPAEALLERIRVEKQRLVKEGKIKKDKHESIIFRRDNSHYEKLDGVECCIDDEIPFDLPESWKWVRLGCLLKIESGKSLTSKEMKPGTIPVYGGNGITGYHNTYLVDKETVVIGRVGYYCGSVYITEPKAWVTDNAFITTYPTECIDRDYLVFTLRSMNLGQNNNATAQPVVSGKKIYPKLFPLPPLAEQKRIAMKLKEILPLCEIM